MLKSHFSKFLGSDPKRLHFAAHSHHPWPDISEHAHAQYWTDSATFIDDKWEHVFSNVIPEAQAHIATELKLPASSTVFAVNTHELVTRLFSCLPERASVVTTDSEFHSFERQSRRLEEEGLLQVERVPVEPFNTFADRFASAVKARRPNLVFFSHVFFNSGFEVQNLSALVAEFPAETTVVIDGYHAFCAVPTDLSSLANRAFYLAGGYKYAMAGEGACFMHVPDGVFERPRNTGWFAAFGALESKASDVSYARGAHRFFGATFDPSGLYRFNGVMNWRKTLLTSEKNRAHAHSLQAQFLNRLGALNVPIREEQLVVPLSNSARGQFLTFRTPDAAELSQSFKKLNIVTDARGDRLRFGFGVYQDAADVSELRARLTAVKP